MSVPRCRTSGQCMTTASRQAPATSTTSSRAVTRSPASGIRGMLAGWRPLSGPAPTGAVPPSHVILTWRPPMTDHAISRRRLLGASAAAGLGTMLGQVPGAGAASASSRQRRRGRGRRRVRRPHRRSEAGPGGAIGDRPGGPRQGRRAGAQPADRRRRDLRARRHLRRPHPESHPRPGEGVRGRPSSPPSTTATTSTSTPSDSEAPTATRGRWGRRLRTR